MQRMLALEKALSLGHWAVLGQPINGLWAGFLTQWPNWADPNGPAHGPCTGLAVGGFWRGLDTARERSCDWSWHQWERINSSPSKSFPRGHVIPICHVLH
jgi:hypothetical protein